VFIDCQHGAYAVARKSIWTALEQLLPQTLVTCFKELDPYQMFSFIQLGAPLPSILIQPRYSELLTLCLDKFIVMIFTARDALVDSNQQPLHY
jgi:hypothetical protein